MGRHRRSGPDAAPVTASSRGRGHHRGAHRRSAHPRTGLLGASAALAVGAVAVGTGLLPGLGERLAPDDSADIRAQEQGRSPSTLDALTPSPTLETDGENGDAVDGEEDGAQEREPAEETAEPTAEPSSRAPAEQEREPSAPAEDDSSSPASQAPSPTPTTESPEPEPEPEPSSPPDSEEPDPGADPETVAAGEVVALVNAERAQAGCQPLVIDAALSRLAADHSQDMAERGYFDHTDPDGRDPWDRAAAAGVDNLGGENIAQGQPDAQAVMDAWMNSEGHRANILNCDFTTIGVGVHIAGGGPWWTQDFGF
jgi:uncharacterized protein YkwD